MLTFLVLTAVTFSLFGFIIGIWADGFEKLQMIPMLVVTPLTFLGGSFYSVNMLPPGWRTITLFNPVVYLISGFRWSFYEIADVSVGVSVGMTLAFLGGLHDRGVVDFQDRLPAEELTRKRHSGCARGRDRTGIDCAEFTDSSGNGRSGHNSRGSDGRGDAVGMPSTPLTPPPRHRHRRRPRRRRAADRAGHPVAFRAPSWAPPTMPCAWPRCGIASKRQRRWPRPQAKP